MGKSIREIPKRDRPRERLLAKGAAALSDQELLAVLLGKGSARMDVMTLAGKLARVVDEKGLGTGAADLMQFADRASGVIVAHNHPAGPLEPSPADVDATRQLKSAGEVIGIQLLDHIIFNRSGYFSFLESGTL